MIISKEKVINEIQASLTGTKIEKSASGRKKNSYLLQECEGKESEETNSDAYVTS